jgi:hypothetical protein
VSLISEEYRKQNQVLHGLGDYGTRGAKWAGQVALLCRSMNTKSVLDYGAGQQTLAGALPELNVQSYDPALPEISEAPDPADLVVCTDVLEHIEPECLEEVLNDIQCLAIRAVFLVIATRAAKKTLPDGRNAHLIQQPALWWMPKLMNRWDFRQVTNVQGLEFMFFGKAIR